MRLPHFVEFPRFYIPYSRKGGGDMPVPTVVHNHSMLGPIAYWNNRLGGLNLASTSYYYFPLLFPFLFCIPFFFQTRSSFESCLNLFTSVGFDTCFALFSPDLFLKGTTQFYLHAKAMELAYAFILSATVYR